MSNHASMQTTIYYDWFIMEIILNFALLYIAGNVILCFIFTGYLKCCGKDQEIHNNAPQQVQEEEETEMTALQTMSA